MDTGLSSRPNKEDNSYLAPLKKAGDKPYFADGFPYLLLSKPSVDQLNINLENSGADLQVTSLRFFCRVGTCKKRGKWGWVMGTEPQPRKVEKNLNPLDKFQFCSLTLNL